MQNTYAYIERIIKESPFAFEINTTTRTDYVNFTDLTDFIISSNSAIMTSLTNQYRTLRDRRLLLLITC